ncbi:hypothetical protein [Streptomyces sp. NBC_01451]|uniref:hypothetical protein n=1 Tax=Streptomyces sp. NBC_01451 TaxID=2903872 RepID=UPI002E33269A|nr:hypothetical protein [Streptomyces sp. NBC_01451]
MTRLLPCPEIPGLFATIRPTGSGESHQERQNADVYADVWRRHSGRFPFCHTSILPDLRAELGAAARVEGARLTFAEATARDRLLRLTAEAAQRDRLDVGRATEGRRWAHHALGPA